MQRVKNNRKQSLDSEDTKAEKAEKSSEKASTKNSEQEESTSSPEPVVRKKVSKRTASVAALAAISDTKVKDEELEEELFKPLSPLVEAKSSSSKKAVAIVRPQPQQVISG